MTSRKKKEFSSPQPEQPEDHSQSPESPVEGELKAAEPLDTGFQEKLDQLEMDNAQLRVALEAAQAQAKDYLDATQRLQAEFINYKRRIERDLTSSVQNSTGNAIRRYLDVADDLERALKNRPQEGDGTVWAQGIDLIYRKLLNAFEADGVKMIDAEGQPFDPNLHEAISQEDHPDFESGQVIGVVQAGYTLGERVLRPARVRVAR
jgi:molecular chaperone GrpE